MILPKSVKVGPFIYKIVPWESKSLMGVCLSPQLLIKIDIRYPKSVVYNTLWHELFHAIYYVQAIDDMNEEEQTVCSFANGFQALMIDNPELKKYL